MRPWAGAQPGFGACGYAPATRSSRATWPATGVDLLIVTDAGYGKRTKLDHFNAQTRGGQGVRGIKLTQRRGAVVAALMASLEDEIIVVSSAGVMIRTSVREIAAQGRDATGVRVMNLDDGQTVAAVAKVPQEIEVAGDQPRLPIE